MPLRALITASIFVALAGCQFLNGTMPAATNLAASPQAGARPARRTMQLELLFVRHDVHDEEMHDELWRSVDEQFLAPEIRDRLSANGLRVGLVGDHLPPHLRQRFTANASSPEAGTELATDAAISRRLLQLLPNRRGEIVTGSGIHECVLLERVDDSVSGATYRDATALFSIEATPAANGAVQVTVVPEIKHGPLEKSWVGEDGMFRLETGQHRHRLEHLSFTATLPRDGMLVVGSSGEDAVSVGDCFLEDRDRGSGTTTRLLAIRALADSVDPLFASGEPDAPLTDDSPLTIR